ncbi:hypothetical protein [Sediminibacillus halophilus]|uniref:Spore coat protein YutH n=1 Tax=Sediminibacillus halophilus TaxID=482461 RepID=A0A1G9QSM1_9BACI|nr:hypothetical protein [Sediminibacillus halophilus]SDM13840.1 spore coat protein YutH [Sediminibacillus halophilus]
MLELLSEYIDGFHGSEVTINGMKGYRLEEGCFFIIPKSLSDKRYFEQKSVGEYFFQNGFTHLAIPIVNKQGELFTEFGGQSYVVLYAMPAEERKYTEHGANLASFHQIGRNYPYQPFEAAAYGQWKELWISKLALFDSIYQQQYNERPVSRFQRLFIDTYPYVSGCTENALQYLQEAESEQRFDEGDGGSFTFQRYSNQVQQQTIWQDEIVYDHAARDIAEYIRGVFLQPDSAFSEIEKFLFEYQSIKPLSIFSWRLIYARLLLPIHLFDYIETGISSSDPEITNKGYVELLENQPEYEQKMRTFFADLGLDHKALHIPVLDW